MASIRPLLALLVLALTGCNRSFHDVGTPPALSPVGEELPIHDVIIPRSLDLEPKVERMAMQDNAIWDKRSGIYFRDTRAYNVGDILTVTIEMNDSARFDNKSEKDALLKGSLTGGLSADIPDIWTTTGSLDGSLQAGKKAERSGSVNRRETLRLQVAAAVLEASANGNLYILGTQEVRVNHELRILTVEGVVRSQDILSNNTIPYEKIAEARISYGGLNTARRNRYPGYLAHRPNAPGAYPPPVDTYPPPAGSPSVYYK